MAHLTDMEELLATIPSPDTRDYMREAMNCYMAGAYRGAVVLSYIALFDNLLCKLGELGNVNSTAKTIFTDASKKKTDQDVYESFLIDQLTSKNLISGLDSSFLTTLRTLRNKSAHPSGHRPSPEEARFIYFETINRFLSKPVLSTTHLIDEIVDRLKNANFFPSNIITDIAAVVGQEISSLYTEAATQLIAKLAAAAVSTDKTICRNACLFLLGLAQQEKQEILTALQSRLISAKSDDSEYADLLMQLLSSNGKLFIGLNATIVARIKATLSTKIAEVTVATTESSLIHPTQTLSSISSAMAETEFVSTFQSELKSLFDKRAHSEFVVKLVSERLSLLPLYFSALLIMAGSYDFDTANSFSNVIESMDSGLDKLLNDEQAFQLLVAVMQAANNGAWSAKGVTGAKFANSPLLRAKAIAYINANKITAATYIKEKLRDSRPIDNFVAAHLVNA